MTRSAFLTRPALARMLRCDEAVIDAYVAAGMPSEVPPGRVQRRFIWRVVRQWLEDRSIATGREQAARTEARAMVQRTPLMDQAAYDRGEHLR